MGNLGRHKNRFDVQVVFPDLAFGIKNRPDVDLTPADVADSLEEFCLRIRQTLARPPSADASDPHVTDPGNPATRDES